MTPQFKNNNKNNIVSPELIEVGTQYSFNFSPSDDRQFWNNVDRIGSLKTYFTTFILKRSSMHIDAYMEISRNGRLHFHGTCKFLKQEHIIEFFVDHLHYIQNNGIIEIDTISDLDKWLVYCRKSQHLIKCNIRSNEHLINASRDLKVSHKKICEY